MESQRYDKVALLHERSTIDTRAAHAAPPMESSTSQSQIAPVLSTTLPPQSEASVQKANKHMF